MKVKEVLLEKGLLGQFLGGLAGKSATQVDWEQKERKQQKEQEKEELERDKERAKELGISVERYRRLRDEGKLEQYLKDREKVLKGVIRKPKARNNES